MILNVFSEKQQINYRQVKDTIDLPPMWLPQYDQPKKKYTDQHEWVYDTYSSCNASINPPTHDIGDIKTCLRSSSAVGTTTTLSANQGNENEKLGTAFGAETSFNTKTDTFEKNNLTSTTVIYYDNRKNLEKIGISFSKKKQETTPNPFPGSSLFCSPPNDWKK